MKIVADHHIPYVTDYFGSYGELILKPGRQMTAEDVKEADILLVRSVTKVNEELLAHSKVKFVGSVTAGVDHLDTEWLEKAGVPWHAAVGFNAPPVADYVVSVVAALQRRGALPSSGAKAAVIGVGNVGRLVVERLKLLNIEVVLCDPPRREAEPDFRSIALQEIEDVDLISLHVPLTKRSIYPTHHFIDKAFLKKQKEGAVLLNASRGAVINPVDLMLLGTHLNWCFDVWEHEPHIDLNVLNRALIATPHIAGYSVQSKIRGIEKIYRAACEHGIIQAMAKPPLNMPTQKLHFSGQHHHWQDIVLGIFNPMILGAMMRSTLLAENPDAHAFDHLRHQFNYRHEFSFTNILDADVGEEDKALLEQFGMICGKMH